MSLLDMFILTEMILLVTESAVLIMGVLLRRESVNRILYFTLIINKFYITKITTIILTGGASLALLIHPLFKNLDLSLSIESQF